MKLLRCRNCLDVVGLFILRNRSCGCGASRGYYLEDGQHARVKGPCDVLGFHNYSLDDALKTPERTDGMGVEFCAFIIPSSSTRVIREKE